MVDISEALGVMRDWDMLQELQAQAALELVGLELSAEKERSRGLQALPRVLWADGAAVQHFPRLKLDRASYLQQLRKLTTPAEQVLLRF